MVLCAEEGAGDDSLVAGGAGECVAAHLQVVAEIAVAPGRSAAGGAWWLACAPVFERAEVKVAGEAVERDAEVGGASDGLGLGRKAEEPAGPGRGAGNLGIVFEVGQRGRSGGPGLGEAVPERDMAWSR